MFKFCAFFAILAVAFAAPNPKPGLAYSAPLLAAAPALSYAAAPALSYAAAPALSYAAPVVSAPVVSYGAHGYPGYVAPSVYGSHYVW